jgi:hypothetical protein
MNPISHLVYYTQNYSLFGIGFPPMHILISAIPMALMGYIIGFGDIVFADTLYKSAAKERPDEKYQYPITAVQVVSSVRNFLHAFFAPSATMSGPVWVGQTAAMTIRYQSNKSMHSIVGGSGTFNIWHFVAYLILPLYALFSPILPIGIGLIFTLQAFVCFYMAIGMCPTREEIGLAGIIGTVLAVQGPTVGLAIAIVVTFVIMYRGKEPAAQPPAPAAPAKAAEESETNKKE